MTSDHHGLPTPRSTLRAGYLDVLVWCKACHRQAPADLQILVDTGRPWRRAAARSSYTFNSRLTSLRKRQFVC